MPDFKEIDLREWEELLPSSGYEVFHDARALAVLDDHSRGEMRLFAEYKGGQAVALVPVFVRDAPVGKIVTSPPVSLGVPRLGPVVAPRSPKRRKRERVNCALTERIIDALDLDRRTTFFRMICPLEYDPRPFGWNDFEVEPRFTYVVDLTNADLQAIMRRFSKSLRNEMRRYENLDLRVETEGIDAAIRICEDVIDQYEEYEEIPPVSRPFLRDLLTALDDDRWRTYVARTPLGDYESGIVVLFSEDLAYYWQGGVAASYENVSVNSIIHRVILEDILTDPALESVNGYDLVGANTKRLIDYKGKFGGDLHPYYVVESSGSEMDLAKSTYARFRRMTSSLGGGPFRRG